MGFDPDGWLEEHDSVLTPKFDYAFSCFDRNGDGRIDERDFLQLADTLRTRLGWASGEQRYGRLRDSLLEFWEMMATLVDADKSGDVGRDEFTLFERRMFEQTQEFGGHPPPWALEFVVALFYAVDVNRDGRIGPKEYALLLEAVGSEMDPGEAFAKLDRDGSGHLEASELEGMLVQYFTSTHVEDPGNYLLTGGWPGM